MGSSIVRSFLALAVVLGFGMGCQSPAGPDDTVTASIRGLALRIENRTDEPVFYAPVEQDMAARVLLALCVDTLRCPVIPPGGIAAISLAEVDGFESTSDLVLVHWWQRVPGPAVGYYEAGPVEVIVVRRHARVWGL